MTDEQTGRARGGEARAAKLSPERRSEIARMGALAKKARADGDTIPKAEWGTPDRPLRIGDLEIACYVLSDTRRVLIQSGVMSALNMKQGTAGRGSGDRLTRFIETKSIKPFVNNTLVEVIKTPIIFQAPNGSRAYGYEATVLPDLCDAVLEARKEGRLHYQQEHIAAQCEALVRSLAKLGIIALVDEATGYQEVRARDALQAFLDRFLRKELAAWVKTFPDEFFREMFRLKGWAWKGTSRRPGVVGHYINDLIYDRLGPGVLEELQRKNPTDGRGRRKSKHTQWLTEDIGHPALAQHMYATIGLMRAHNDWKSFQSFFKRAFPKKGENLALAID